MKCALPPIVTTIGLCLDIVGALFVANEVVRIFRGPLVVEKDIGPGHFAGTYPWIVNPDFETHEVKKRKIMKWGLVLLVLGFLFQVAGTWLSYCYS